MKRLVKVLTFASVVSFVLLVAVGASGSGSKSAVSIPDFTVAQESAPGGANWITENGNIPSWRYSSLSQINASNGGSLKLAWSTHIANPTAADRSAAANEMPLVYNGVTYVEDTWWRVTALDAGSVRWVAQASFKLPPFVALICDSVLYRHDWRFPFSKIQFAPAGADPWATVKSGIETADFEPPPDAPIAVTSANEIAVPKLRNRTILLTSASS